MTPELYSLLQEWLHNGTEIQRAHAKRRLELHDNAMQYPSLWQQAANIAAATGRAIVSGFATVSQEEQDRRLAICLDCEFYDQAQGRCTKCGCFGRWKTFLATEHCPLPEPKW